MELILMISLFTIGLNQLLSEHGLFKAWQLVSKKSNGNIRSVIFEPISECVCCMSSFWTCIYFGHNHIVEVVVFFMSVLVIMFLDILSDNDFIDGFKSWYLVFVFLFGIALKEQTIIFFVTIVCVYAINCTIEKITVGINNIEFMMRD